MTVIGPSTPVFNKRQFERHYSVLVSEHFNVYRSSFASMADPSRFYELYASLPDSQSSIEAPNVGKLNGRQDRRHFDMQMSDVLAQYEHIFWLFSLFREG
jgi:hypothetical protein